MKKSGIIIASLIFLIVIVLLTVKGCVDSKGSSNSTEKSTSVVEQSSNSSKATSNEKETKKESESKEQSGVIVQQSSDGDLVRVDIPTLKDTKTSSVMVSGKSAYLYNSSSFVYSIQFLLPDGDGFKTLTYFCSKKTYDSLSMGDTVEVTYQLDSGGMTSISSVTKK